MNIENNLNLYDNLIENGKEYFKSGNYISAIETYQKILSIEPSNKHALFEIGKTYFVIGQYCSAIDFLKKAKEKDPGNEHTSLLLAKAYSNLGNYELAIRELMELNRLGSHIYDVDKELSLIYRERYGRLTDIWNCEQKLDMAIEDYEKKLKINPMDEKAISHLVQIYNFIGNYDATKEKARQALRYIPAENIFSRNKILNELEIAEGRIVLSSKVRSLNVTLSRRCNLRCIMCLPPSHPWEIPDRTIKEICSLFPYLEKIMWQGGEVFVLEYFEELLSETHRYPNIRQSIVTNAQLITESIAEKLVKNNIELTVSIDGTTKDTYEYIRRGARFETLIRNLKLISDLKRKYKSNMILNLNVAVMKSNYRQLESFVDFAKEYGFEFLCLMPMEIPIKKSTNTPEDIFVYNKNMEALHFITKVSPIIEERAKRYNIRLENRLPRLIEENAYISKDEEINHHSDNTEITAKKLLCHIPWQQLLIDYDGIVRPDCQCSLEKNAGSLLDGFSLAEIWNNKIMQDYRRAMLTHNYHNLCSRLCIEGKISETHLKIP
jgi:MoaA/NifB/PqqE/SkfB family radical SAM enzyme/lipopolysaccharide biosynthesis regulator YciM